MSAFKQYMQMAKVHGFQQDLPLLSAKIATRAKSSTNLATPMVTAGAQTPSKFFTTKPVSFSKPLLSLLVRQVPVLSTFATMKPTTSFG